MTIDGAGIELPDWLAGLVDLSGLSYMRVSGLRVIHAGTHPPEARRFYRLGRLKP